MLRDIFISVLGLYPPTIIKNIPCPNFYVSKNDKLLIGLTLSQVQILAFSKLKEFAGNNFDIDENGRKFFKRLENTVGKGEIARFKQFLLFPQCFQKTYTADT